MPHVCESEWLLGWDAETELETPANWVDPGIELLESNPRLFHTSLAWPGFTADGPATRPKRSEGSGTTASTGGSATSSSCCVAPISSAGSTSVSHRWRPLDMPRTRPHSNIGWRPTSARRAGPERRSPPSITRRTTFPVASSGGSGLRGSSTSECERSTAWSTTCSSACRKAPGPGGPIRLPWGEVDQAETTHPLRLRRQVSLWRPLGVGGRHEATQWAG